MICVIAKFPEIARAIVHPSSDVECIASVRA